MKQHQMQEFKGKILPLLFTIAWQNILFMSATELQFYVTEAKLGLAQKKKKKTRTTQKSIQNRTEIAQCMLKFRVNSFTYTHSEGEREAH